MSIRNKKRFGLILRTFATKKEDAEKRVEAIGKAVTTALSLDLFARIDIVVWADKRYSDADCGETFEAIRWSSVMMQSGADKVHLHSFEHGDLFCGLLNFGVAKQMRDRIDYSFIASTEAVSYMTEGTVSKMLGALEAGALATGVAISELTDSVLDGRLANTLCAWDNIALMSVGGFDLRAAKPTGDKTAYYMRGLSPEGKEVFYQLAGTEEVIPLARLVEANGPCIAPILPDGVARYQVPDPVKQPELYLRHISKMGTKYERQSALLSSVGFDLSFLRNGVMPAYRAEK